MRTGALFLFLTLLYQSAGTAGTDTRPADRVAQVAEEVTAATRDTLYVPVAWEGPPDAAQKVSITGLGALRGRDMTVFAVRVPGLARFGRWEITIYLNADNDRKTGRNVNNGGVDYQLSFSSGGGVNMFAWINPDPGRPEEVKAAARFGVLQKTVPLAAWGLGAFYAEDDLAYVFIKSSAFQPIPPGNKATGFVRITAEEGSPSAQSTFDFTVKPAKYFLPPARFDGFRESLLLTRKLAGYRLAARPSLEIWDLGTEKVLQGEKPEPVPDTTRSSLELAAAIGEYESRSLLLRSDGPLRSVTITARPFTGQGRMSPSLSIETADFVEVQVGQDNTRRISDYLRPETTLAELGPGEQSVVWLTVHVPYGVEPGAYRSVLHVSRGDREEISVPVSLTVFGFELPRTPSLPVICRLSIDGVGRGLGGELKTIEQALPLYDELFLSHRICYRQIYPDPVITRDGDKVRIAWEAFDRRAEQVLDRLGMSRFQPPYTQLGSHGSFYGFLGEKDPSGEAFQRLWADYLTQMLAHFREKKWFDKMVFVIWDEPYSTAFPAMKELSRIACSIDERIRPAAFISGVYPELVGFYRIWIDGAPSDLARARQKAGDEFWQYNCFPGDSSVGVATRQIFWSALINHIDGLSQWVVNNWRQNPRDLLLLNKGGPPIRSIEWALMREGQEDYEYFRMLKEIAEGRSATSAQVRRQAAEIYGQFVQFAARRCPDLLEFEALRVRAGLCLGRARAEQGK